jgi:hypothetical protein
MIESGSQSVKLKCPECHGERVYRSRRRGISEWYLRLVYIYPFRCDICGHRFRRFMRQHVQVHT